MFNEIIYEDCSISDLKIGDNIIVYFCPDSQKYIDELIPIEGEVTRLGDTINDLYVKDHNDDEHKVAYDSCHYFGMTLGYTFWITRRVT